MSHVRDAYLTALLQTLADTLAECANRALQASACAHASDIDQAIGMVLSLEDDLPAAAGLMRTILSMQRRRLRLAQEELRS